jgi:hypothetical protein
MNFDLVYSKAKKAGLPDFSWYKITKRDKIYQITTNTPNGHKMYQLTLRYSQLP